MPDRIFTPEMIALIKKGKPYTEVFRHTTGKSGAQAAPNLYEQIPVSQWKELISPFAPVSMTGAGRNRTGMCPFCGKPFPGCSMRGEEFISSPFQAKTACCGTTVYARKEDMPPDYPAKPNHTEPIPHLDGTVYNYDFYVPPGKQDDRHNWFCSAGEVWRVRQKHFIDILFLYSPAVFYNNDEKAALQLVAIFDRLADVLPGYPLYDSQMPHGFARGRDGKNYLTRDEYRSVPCPQRFEKPFWFRWENWHFDKLPASSRYGSWQNGVMMWAGVLAASFDMIRDRPEVKAWSTSRYGSPDAFEKCVINGVFKEYQFLCKSVPGWGRTWIKTAFKLGIIMQDEYFFQETCRLLESNIINNYFSDGLNFQGSFAYAACTRGVVDNLWMVEHFAGIDLNKKYPYLKQIRDLGDYPIQTLYNIESMHGDTHGLFFATQRIEEGIKPPAPGAEDYPAHETSLCFPETGLACLRAGVPGNRLETIIDFQATSTSHSHNGRLNIQLFYEGVNLLPDFGYGSRLADLSKPPWKDYEYNFEKLLIPIRSKLFREAYVKQPQSHCMALVDGVNNKRGPATFHRFLGGQGSQEPAYAVQFIEADARAVFFTDVTFKSKNNVSWDPAEPRKVSRFRRQLVTITLPNGRSVALDIFRIKGGKKHEMYWHVPAETARMSMGKPETLEHETVQEYMRSVHGDPPSKFKYSSRDSSLKYLNSPKRWETPDKAWRAEWLIQPSKFEPVTPEGRKRYEKWSRILHDVKLRMWGFSYGGNVGNSEILGARGPWPSGMAEEDKRGKVVVFKDALDFLIESRWIEQAPLESCFVHVLEPYNPSQGPALADVEALTGETNDATGGCAVRLSVRKNNSEDNTSDLLLATTVDGGTFQGKDIHLQGRLGMACRDELSLVLYDGTELQAQDFGVSLESGWRLELENVVGDLTGDVGESALIVTSANPLPTDATLAGQTLTVYHQISDIHTTGYTIDRVRSLGKHRYRIDLRGQPPFIQYGTRVRKLDKDNPFHVYGSSPNNKGACSGLFQGRRIRFPRTGFSSAIRAILWARKSGTDLVAMKTAPREADVAVGDPFVIHTIQPGDEVVIPSLFAARAGATDNDQVDLRIFTTGTATVRIPDIYQPMSLVSGGKPIVFEHKETAGRLAITIDHGSIEDGRAVLSLSVK